MAELAICAACDRESPIQPTQPPATCTYTLGSTSLSFAATAGKASISVTAGAGCAWTAVSDRGWLAIEDGASGAGSGTVTVSITANANRDSRSGTLTVAGQPVAVTQAGAEVCTLTIAPATASHSKDATTGTFGVTTPASCDWTAVGEVPWVTVAQPSSGRGSASVTYAVSRNMAVESRTGVIRVGPATFTIAQAGDSGACDYHVAPVEMNVCMSVPLELTAIVTTQPSCGWTVAPDAPWISIAGGTSRSGSGEVRFRVSDNYDPPRLGVLRLRWDAPTAGQNVRVSQAGCRYAVSVTTIAVPDAGGTRTFDVYQQSDPTECGGPLQNRCVWTAGTVAPWIAISTPMPQAGDGRVTFSVAPNAGPARSAAITVRDKTVLVLQSGS